MIHIESTRFEMIKVPISLLHLFKKKAGVFMELAYCKTFSSAFCSSAVILIQYNRTIKTRLYVLLA